jgi:hypothetical protein
LMGNAPWFCDVSFWRWFTKLETFVHRTFNEDFSSFMSLKTFKNHDGLETVLLNSINSKVSQNSKKYFWNSHQYRTKNTYQIPWMALLQNALICFLMCQDSRSWLRHIFLQQFYCPILNYNQRPEH